MTANPADSSSMRWLDQLGSLIQAPAPGKWVETKSAPTRSAPVPPGVWAVVARFSRSTGWPAPNSSSCTWPAKRVSPAIPRYCLVRSSSSSIFSACFTALSTGQTPCSSR